jgi:single-stranded-DNA-specific exonuclease
MTGLPWRLRRALPPGPEPWRPLARAWDLSPEAARLAWLRSADSDELAWRLDPDWGRATDPRRLPGVLEAAARIRAAIAAGETLCVYGDYDVDGVTATALLLRVLKRLGAAQASFFIPNRFSDGYGLSLDCIREVTSRLGPCLLISVDCGVRSLEEVRASRELGAEWIITDHHSLGEALPDCTVVHPGLEDYPNPHLAGVGVAFKLAQALLGDAADAAFLDGLLKLVALGTVADMVPLRGENALLVKRGLRAMAGANGAGISALLRAAKAEAGPRARDVAFQIGPRLNAAGRMGGAEDAVQLLLARDPGAAAALMDKVEDANRRRRGIQQALGERLPGPGEAAFDLVVDPEAHKGVIGIVAGQRMRAILKPSAVCTVTDGVAQCSVRAPEGYDLRPLLERIRPYLTAGGGHRSAAGLSFPLKNLPFVRAALERGAEEQAALAPDRALPLDGDGTALVPLAAELDRLEPFGQGFPEPVFHVGGRLDGAPRTFGDGFRKFRLRGEPQEFTLFNKELALDGNLSLAAVPQDHPRFGRSWRVESLLEPAETP